jgi:hypothetical protein
MLLLKLSQFSKIALHIAGELPWNSHAQILLKNQFGNKY